MSKMSKPKSNPGADAIVSAIQESSRVAKEGTDRVANDLLNATEKITQELSRHVVHDVERFTDLNNNLVTVGTDVKSLLTTRTFTYGVWKTLTVIGVTAAGVASIIALFVPFVQSLFAGK